MDNIKLQELRKYSDPAEVAKIGKRYGLDVFVSSRKDKKYMVKIGDKNKSLGCSGIDALACKVIHFGQMNYEDYTKHKDVKRRDLFRKRNHKWASSPKDSASYLSFYLLWA